MRATKSASAAFLLFVGAVDPASAQDRVPTQAQSFDRDTQPDEIIVEGYRQRPDAPNLRPPGTVSSVNNRQRYAFSERLAKCAARSRLSSLSKLRAVVDGEFGSNSQQFAQDRLKRIYIACSETTDALRFTSTDASIIGQSSAMTSAAEGGGQGAQVGGVYNEPAPLGRSIYDRGAFVIQALKRFAPGLVLTTRDTNDRAVQIRFNSREVPRNRFRLGSDYKYWTIAVCMVRVEPRLAVRLAYSDGPASFGDLQSALIDRARVCVGGTKNVRVDPTQFRIYIADAVYRWAVAVRGVDTLIPDNAEI